MCWEAKITKKHFFEKLLEHLKWNFYYPNQSIRFNFFLNTRLYININYSAINCSFSARNIPFYSVVPILNKKKLVQIFSIRIQIIYANRCTCTSTLYTLYFLSEITVSKICWKLYTLRVKTFLSQRVCFLSLAHIF